MEVCVGSPGATSNDDARGYRTVPMKKIGCKIYMHWRIFLCVWWIRKCPFCKSVEVADKQYEARSEKR